MNHLAKLTDTFAPEIDDLIQNLQEMAENLTIIDRRKTPKEPRNAPMTDRKDQTWATFTDRLRLHCECSNLQWTSQLYGKLETGRPLRPVLCPTNGHLTVVWKVERSPILMGNFLSQSEVM
jgi:hypothetical protein